MKLHETSKEYLHLEVSDDQRVYKSACTAYTPVHQLDCNFLISNVSFEQDGVLHSLQTSLPAGLSDRVQVLPWMVSAQWGGRLSVS